MFGGREQRLGAGTDRRLDRLPGVGRQPDRERADEETDRVLLGGRLAAGHRYAHHEVVHAGPQAEPAREDGQGEDERRDPGADAEPLDEADTVVIQGHVEGRATEGRCRRP